MNSKHTNHRFDFAFVGLGASNSLILISLFNKGLLQKKSVAIFETDSKTQNDKTYCFWAAPNESIVRELYPIISKSFSHVRINSERIENIESCPYHYIKSIDLYNTTKEILGSGDIAVFRETVREIAHFKEIHTTENIYQSEFIFDSRPPNLDLTKTDEIFIQQSFLGWHIKCEQDVFQENCFEMMNFEIEQDGYTQFMYVIPFSKREALVEFTRFDAEKIEEKYAQNKLKTFIEQKFSAFEILGEERGSIPMTTHISRKSTLLGVLHTGTRANLIKPSTGYGFKNMYDFSELVSGYFVNQESQNFNKIQLESKSRFKLYDKLLLIILLHWPSLGKNIFTQLYNKIPVTTIFSFLEERSSWREEVRIFSVLPKRPFINALLIYFQKKNWTRYFIALFVFVVYSISFYINSENAAYLSYLMLFVGLMWIGIPHGALDHLLSKNNSTPLPIFITKYLLIMVVYLTVWLFAPSLALLIFIVYSAFHFGESELVQNEKNVTSMFSYLRALLLGMSILTFITTNHFEESLLVIETLINIQWSTLDYENLNTWAKWLSILSFAYILMESMLNKMKAYTGLLYLLFLGVLVPLPLAFGFYFVLQHSHNAWHHLQKGLQISGKELYKKALFFTIGAMLVFVVIAFMIRGSEELQDLLINFFIFIACISLPHFVLMHLFYKSKHVFKFKNS